MSDAGAPLQIRGLVRSYGGLRPLRLTSLAIAPRERVSIDGIDAAGAEVLVNLVTGAALPDEGTVTVFGRATSEISDPDEWLASLERFGIVSPRAVLMEGATLEQNLAMPFTLEIDAIPAEIAARVAALAVECGIVAAAGPGWRGVVAGHTAQDVRARLHVARALALEPELAVLEHPTAGVDERARRTLADDVSRALDARGLAALVITQDDVFASRVAHRRLRLQPATGELRQQRRAWFG